MGNRTDQVFHEWLRGQLRAKKMTQRQLGQQSGVDHSTISRLVRGEREPSLGTAAKIARGLRTVDDGREVPLWFGVTTRTTSHATAQVEYALRADELMNEHQVRQVMDYYLALRARRLAIRTRAIDPVMRTVPKLAKGH